MQINLKYIIGGHIHEYIKIEKWKHIHQTSNGWSWLKVLGWNSIRWSGMTITVKFQLFHKDTIISYCLWNWSLLVNIILNLKQCLRGDVTQFSVQDGVTWGPEEPHKFSRVTSWICGRTEAQMSLPAPISPISYSMAGQHSPSRFVKI